MIGYVLLGTNDVARAGRFYDAVLGPLGAKRSMEADNQYILWAVEPGRTALGVTVPYDRNAASVGNGVMIALGVKTPAEVDAVYAMAIEAGAQDEGKAGPRGEHFYAGYFRDPDGNKLSCYCTP